ncbi:MAG TPA: amino acid adenylation domain-containing protein [Puia sp.]|nr:amino acid adenylation domain-containing protein [Puia sp.]
MDVLTVSGKFEFSYNQKGIWSLGDIDRYYNQLVIRFDGRLDKLRLREALAILTKRHEVLSSGCWLSEDSTFPFQTSFENGEIHLQESGTLEDNVATVIQQANEYLSSPYDPSTHRPVRFYLGRLEGEKYLFFIRLFSLWGDSYSCALLVRELCQVYFKIQPGFAEDNFIGYRNFSQWQNDLQNEPDEEGIDFWDKYKYFPQRDIMPFGKKRELAFGPVRVELDLVGGKRYASVKDICASLNTSVANWLFGLFGIYLGNFTQQDFTVGYLPFKRSYKELDATLGMVSKTLPVHFSSLETNNIEEMVKFIGRSLDEMMAWSDYFYRDPASFFQYCFEFLELDKEDGLPAADPSFEVADLYTVTDLFSIKLSCIDHGDRLGLELYYDGNKFNEGEAGILIAQLKALLERNIDGGGETLTLSDREIELIGSSNDTENKFNGYTSIVSLFEQQVNKTPDAIAVMDDDSRLTYRQLDQQSNRLAHLLAETYDIVPGDLIGIMMQRSSGMITGLLGILKSGAAYVPLDPDYPSERVAHILMDSKAKLLVSEKETMEQHAGKIGSLPVVIWEEAMVDKFSLAPLNLPLQDNSPAYVIYTSGSTGLPKGCMLSHGNLSNYIQWANTYYFGGGDTGNWGCITSVSFDLTVTSLYTPLTRGKKLYLGSSKKDIAALLEECFSNGEIDTLKLTPSHLSLLERMDILKTNISIIICGGEELNRRQIDAVWRIKRDIRIYNEYGPTETTVGSVVKEITRSDQKILVGKPIANTQIHILDPLQVMSPVGVSGEIYIAGSGLATGYLNQAQLTRDAFVANPFRKGEKMYKTGDSGRWLPDGNIEFIGRKDEQVKIRGYRIELAEIENALRGYQGIDSAIVLMKPDAEGEKELIACITGRETLNMADIRLGLSKILPAYMIPGQFILLERMPLTINGKIDRKKLLELEWSGMATGVQYIAPRNEVEQQLVSIWQKILGREKIGIKDNFLDLGGHSLKATRLASQIHKEFNVKITLRTLLALPVLEDQAQRIQEAQKTPFGAITPAAAQTSYPLSSSQHRLWILCQLDEGNTAYNIPGVFQFEGVLDRQALTLSFRSLISRHEILRTTFREDDQGEIRQFVHPPEEAVFRLSYQDLRQESERHSVVKKLVQEEITAPFSLIRGPLLRAGLFQLEDDRWIFTYTMHHIISDGWSISILIKELLLLYNSYRKGQPDLRAPLRIQYKDYAVWQQAHLLGGSLKAHQQYWLKQLEGDIPLLELIGDRVRPAIKTYHGNIIYKKLGPELSRNIRSFCGQQGCTLFMGLLGAVNLLLYKYTGQKDIIIGSPVAGRTHADLEEQIGFYVNTLALRTRFSAEENSGEFLENIRQITLEAYEHQDYPFDKLVDDLDLQKDSSRSPLFDVMVVLQNNEMVAAGEVQDRGELIVNGCEWTANTTSKFDLVFNFWEEEGEILTGIEYNSDIYDKDTIAVMGSHFEQLLHAMMAQPSIPVRELNCLSQEEQHRLLYEFNDTAVTYPSTATVIDLFEEQVDKTPDQPAVITAETVLSYQELNKSVNRLAGYLRKKYDIRSDDRIAIRSDRSEWMIVAILGTLKSGAAYVPIDPEYPEERIKYMLRHSHCKAVIDKEEIEKFRENEMKYEEGNPEVIGKPHDLAYVIYTSGTTGNPKGVMIEHRSLYARLNYFKATYKLGKGDSILFYRSYSFDGSIEEYLLPVMTGAACIIAPMDFKQDILANMISMIGRYKITKVNMPPVLLGELVQFADTAALEKLSSLQHVVSGGDRLTVKIVNNYLSKFKARLYNTYGPTENTVDSTNWCSDGLTQVVQVPIGRPIQNSQAFILDDYLNLVPMGACGELYVSGAGLARGYLNDPAQTAEKFLPHPFRKGEKLYRTGDLGKWLPDGSIVFAGRKDDQVKISGFRIELPEIENALQGHPDIDSAVVMVRGDSNGGKDLVAYLVSKKVNNISDIRSWLSRTLPAYMLPDHYIQLEHLPLTSNGKVDKKSLPGPEKWGLESGIAYLAPRNVIERHLVTVYEEVLRKQHLGMKDNFFDLGGDSIKSIQIVARLKQKGYTIPVRDIMMYPVLEDLARHVKANSRSIGQETVKGPVPLSPVQHAFFQRDLPHRHHYNQSVLLYSGRPVPEEGLRAALDKLVLHHDALRMVYQETPHGWTQVNRGEELRPSVEVIETWDESSFKTHCDRIQSTIDLEQGPLLKAGLFQSPEGARLLLAVHHLVIDGVSWRILLEDFSALYQSCLSGTPMTLPLKTDSFQHWQARQMEYARALQNEKPYWSALQNVYVAPLPLDDRGGSNLVKDITSNSFFLDRSLTTDLLTKCHRAWRTGIDDVLLTALCLGLNETFGLDKIMVNMEGHGREDIGADTDVTRTIGWFTTVYPVIFDLRYKTDMIRQLIEVKETLHRVPGKGIGYGILRYLAGEKDNLTPEITFNYLGGFDSDIQTAKGNNLFEFSDGYRGQETSDNTPRDTVLEVSGMIVQGRMRLSVIYSTRQFNASTIDRLVASYERYLSSLISQLADAQQVNLTPVDLTWKSLSFGQVMKLKEDHDLEDAYPLSPLQEGLYYHWLAAPASPVYFEQTAYRLKGDLDIGVLDSSYRALIQRHAVLRTFFLMNATPIPLQIVKKIPEPSFFFKDLAGNTDLSIEEFKAGDRAKGFDLHKAPPIRLTVLSLGDDTYEFIWSHHHILMDGWCGSILIREFFQLYYDLIRGKTPELKEVYPYAGYIEWLMNKDPKNSLTYWSNYLADYDTIATLPKTITGENGTYLDRELSFFLKGSLRLSVRNLCAELGITENTFIQTAWGILLSRYNNTNDVVFGSVVSGRPAELEGIEDMIGLFINAIPVRIRVKEDRSVRELLQEVQQASIAGMDHHYIQLAEIQSASELGRDLFDHMVVFENYPVKEMVEQNITDSTRSKDLTFLSAEVFEQSNYDFSIMVVSDEDICIRFRYNANVYERAQMERLQLHLTRLIDKVLEDPSGFAFNIDFLSLEEKRQLLTDFNDTRIDYPAGKTLSSLFEEQVSRTPDGVALVYENKTFSYKELNERADQLAGYLLAKYDIQGNERVGIKLDRSEWMIIAILAVLKSGAAYVPIDPGYPVERIGYIIADSGCKGVLDKKELNTFEETAGTYTKPHRGPMVDDLAYVIYTSGSTGQPKAVMIQHKSIVNTIYSQKEIFGVKEGDRNLQFASPSFDASVSEIFVAFASGGSLYMIDEKDKTAPSLVEQFITKNKIDIATIPPAYLKLMEMEGIKTLKRLVTAGEAAIPEKAMAFSETGIFYNAYGPTESSICASVYTFDKNRASSSRNVPIGTPIANTKLYIVDNYMNLMPPGTTGEICISGAGLASGYLHSPELTEKKFLPNPFVEGERIYKTGDLGRWLPDGNMEFSGRKDDQVKIRGYRVELGEIESALQSHPGILSAVVLARKDHTGETNLAAYVTGTENLSTTGLQTFLSKTLPSFMLPAWYVQLEEFPLTVNGKVDRNRLPSPDEAATLTAAEYVAPRYETEEKLVSVWEEILGRKGIGIEDNFFEAGGNSIRIIRLAAKVSSLLEREMPVTLLFRYPTIKDLSDYLREEEVDFEEEDLDKAGLMDDLNKFNYN